MPKMTVEQIEAALSREVRKIDQSVLVAAVEQSKKKDFYRVTLLKDRKSSSAELKKEVVEKCVSQKGEVKELKKALGKAVSHLSIRYRDRSFSKKI